jgi:predicted nucleotidyltransferase
VTEEYVDRLVRAYPSIREVWLFGSRANDRARADSDWDYMVFADNGAALLHDLHPDTQFNHPQVDLFIVVAPDVSMNPWSEEANDSSMMFLDDKELHWRAVSETEAQYSEPINRDLDNAPGLVTRFRTAKAVRVYPRP